MPIENKKLLQWYSRGLIPGPGETEDAFIERVHRSPALADEEMWKEAQACTHELFSFKVDWIEAIYSNHNLSFWEGAALWTSPPRLQLKTAFRQGKFLFYKRSELLAHESVHAARLHFKETLFEEMLAYQTSPSSLRRVLGSLFFTPQESLFFLLFLAVVLSLQLFLPFPLYLLIPVAFLFLLTRLTYFRRLFKKCVKKVSLPVAVCLTDDEIKRFSSLSEAEIRAYFEWEGSVRGQLLKVLFLSLKSGGNL